jgi:hypothetical protein
MDGEWHEDVVMFRPAALPGHQAIVLGRVLVGEIGPVADPRSLYPAWYRIDLPHTGVIARVQPADSVDDAKRRAIETIGNWLKAADLRPNGGAT